MNFYLLSDDESSVSIVQNIIESDFSNSLVGVNFDVDSAYDDLLQLRVDVMIINCLEIFPEGLNLIKRLAQVHIKPHFIVVGPHNEAYKDEAYRVGIDAYLDYPFNYLEFKNITKLVGSYCQVVDKMAEINKLTSGIATPFNRPQSKHRLRTDRIHSILRFLGIASENGCDDILRIAKVMVDQNIPFSKIDFQESLSLNEHEKKSAFQRIRRALRVGICNLAGMCIEYPENEVLLEYANSLFDFQNVYNEMQRIREVGAQRGQISIQHFFDGLLQESYREDT